MNKKIIAFLLSLTFILTLIPMNVFAEGTVNEGYTLQESVTKDGLVLNKTVSYNTDTEKLDVTLEVYTTGTVKQKTETKPLDIVMLLDCTGSLSSTELQTLKDSANGFVDAMYETGANHRISVVWFAQNVLLEGSGYYHSDLLPIQGTSGAANLTKVHDTIDKQGLKGATYTHDGVAAVATKFDKATDIGNNRVVVIFTDGVPGTEAFWDDRSTTGKTYRSTTIGNKALNGHDGNQAGTYQLKNSYGAEIYVISMLDIEGITNKSYRATTADKGPKFMNYMSSNYPKATSMTDSGTKVSDKYLIEISNATALNTAFTKVAEDIYPTYSLDEKTAVTDTLSQYFENASDVKVYKETCTGGSVANPTWGTKTDITAGVNVTNDSKTVSVTGFDFDNNCVVPGATNKGAKLVIEFTADPIDGFFGGNKAITNDYDKSGVMVDGELIAKFPEPAVDVPMEYDFEAKDAGIYITDSIKLKDLVDYNDLIEGDVNNLVNIEITIKDAAGNLVGTITIDENDNITGGDFTVSPTVTTDYKVECVISPIYDTDKNTNYDPKEITTIKDTATVFVYTPNIVEYDGAVEKDTVVDLDDYVKMDQNNPWDCKDRDGVVAPQGAAPALTFKYAEIDSDPDVPVTDANNNYTVPQTTNFTVSEVRTANGTIIPLDRVGGVNVSKNLTTKDFTITVVEPETTTVVTTTEETTTEAETTTEETTTQETTTIVIEDETPQAPVTTTQPTTTQPTTTQPTTTKPVVIIEDETPLATVPSTTTPAKKPSKKPAPGTIVIEDETPLGSIPHTADASEPMKWAAIMAVAPVAIAFIKKSKEELEDETN